MDYDLIVIGSGPSGRAAAIQAGKLKRKVLVIDRKSRLCGVSVHTGTIPSKTLRETVLNLTGWRERSFTVALTASKMQLQPKLLRRVFTKHWITKWTPLIECQFPMNFGCSTPRKRTQNRHLFHVGITSVRCVFCAENRFKQK